MATGAQGGKWRTPARKPRALRKLYVSGPDVLVGQAGPEPLMAAGNENAALPSRWMASMFLVGLDTVVAARTSHALMSGRAHLVEAHPMPDRTDIRSVHDRLRTTRLPVPRDCPETHNHRHWARRQTGAIARVQVAHQRIDGNMGMIAA